MWVHCLSTNELVSTVLRNCYHVVIRTQAAAVLLLKVASHRWARSAQSSLQSLRARKSKTTQSSILELILSWPRPHHRTRHGARGQPCQLVSCFLTTHDHPRSVLYMALLHSTQGKLLLSSLVSLLLHCLRTSITVGGTSFNSKVASL